MSRPDILTQIKILINFIIKNPKICAFVLGGFAGLAFAPTYLIFLSFVIFPALLLLLDECQTKKRAFFIGWLFGLGYFLTSLYWISFALLTDITSFWWLFPFALFGIPVLLSFYPALVCLIDNIFKFKGFYRILFFATIWTLFEILRGTLFTGFPWNLTGYVWVFSNSMMQIVNITGIHVLSFFTILAFLGLYLFRNGVKIYLVISISCVPLLMFCIYGVDRLEKAQNQFYNEKIRIVQGNVSQFEKWKTDQSQKILAKYITLSTANIDDDIKYVLWPESAIAYHVNENSGITDVLKQAAPKDGLLIMGSVHSVTNNLGFIDKIWNSIHTISPQGDIVNIYDKHHLVPFGEYVPFKKFLTFTKITQGMIDFSRGEGIQTIDIDGFLSYSPLICYEAIFPGRAINKYSPPKMLINVTNDGWYGDSSGPYQHLNMVKVRAVETGVPLIRAANTGISAVFDAYGRELKRADYGTTSVIDQAIPKSLKQPTFYTKYSDLITYIIMIFSLAICFVCGRKKSV